MKRRQFLATTAGALSTAALAGCTSEDDGEREEGNANNDGNSNDGGSGGSGDANTEATVEETTAAPTTSGSQVELQDHEWYQEQYSAGVSGTIENTTDSTLSYVEVSAYFLDSEGTQIGEGLDNFSDLAGGRKAEFDCMFLGDDATRVDSYELEVEVTDY